MHSRLVNGDELALCGPRSPCYCWVRVNSVGASLTSINHVDRMALRWSGTGGRRCGGHGSEWSCGDWEESMN